METYNVGSFLDDHKEEGMFKITLPHMMVFIIIMFVRGHCNDPPSTGRYHTYIHTSMHKTYLHTYLNSIHSGIFFFYNVLNTHIIILISKLSVCGNN